MPQRDIHCINPNCPRPYPQAWGNKFCNTCGSPLQLENRYIPLQRLGSGGFATIYTVWDLEALTERVLKVLVEPSPKALELFAQEAEVLARLRHPGVPRIEPDGYFYVEIRNSASPSLGQRASLQNSFPERQLPCLVMEKIHGRTLEEILADHPQGCPEKWVISWLFQGLEVLRELHSHKIIHRDIKPSNLMLRDSTGQLVVIDFGGAKQIGPTPSPQASSTRLFSSGYSPPEQISGRSIGPAADLYALGRTMIQLLTGKYPPELEDPLTGELRWRTEAKVSSVVADLLDDMVTEDVRQRPANTIQIQERLTRISPDYISFNSSSGLSGKLTQPGFDLLWDVITGLTTGFGQITLFLVKSLLQVARACWDTFWGMVLSTIGACVGTVTGFGIARLIPIHWIVAQIPFDYLSHLLPSVYLSPGATLVTTLLATTTAGLGTAWGLTLAGGFRQRRRYVVAGVMGILGYGLGWLIWAVVPPSYTIQGLAGLIAVGVAFITLGLGLRSHHLVHAVIASVVTTTVLVRLLPLGMVPNPNGLMSYLVLFSFVSIVLSFCLGVSSYLVVPLLRLLGWR